MKKKKKRYLEYNVFYVMGACVWTNNGNVRKVKKRKRKSGTNEKVTRGDMDKRKRRFLVRFCWLS